MRHENGCERILNLQSPKRMESVLDIIQQICTSNTTPNETDSLKGDTLCNDNDNGIVDISNSDNQNANGENTALTKVKSHFVEIGEYGCGSMFGLGEHMDDRTIVAKQTEVQCLLIPQYWLFEKKQNAGNIWHR